MAIDNKKEHMASKMMACTHEYKPISMNRWSDFDIKGQQFYDVLGNDDPVNAYRRLLKDVLRRKAKAMARKDTTLNVFIEFVEEWKLLVFTMTELHRALTREGPIFGFPADAAALGKKMNGEQKKLYEAGIVLIKGGKHTAQVYLAATEEELIRIGGDSAIQILSEAKAFIEDLHDNDMSQWVPMIEQFCYPEGKDDHGAPVNENEPTATTPLPAVVVGDATGVAESIE